VARNNFSLVTSVEVAAAVAAFKTILQLVAPAGIILAVQEVLLSFDGVSNTAEPVQWELVRQTTAGTMTGRTPLKTKDTSTALQATGQENATVEPTLGDILCAGHIHPQTGAIYPLPLPDGEIELAGAGRLGLRINAPAAVNCRATLKGEE
jgi:hypothetical protein